MSSALYSSIYRGDGEGRLLLEPLNFKYHPLQYRVCTVGGLSTAIFIYGGRAKDSGSFALFVCNETLFGPGSYSPSRERYSLRAPQSCQKSP